MVSRMGWPTLSRSRRSVANAPLGGGHPARHMGDRHAEKAGGTPAPQRIASHQRCRHNHGARVRKTMTKARKGGGQAKLGHAHGDPTPRQTPASTAARALCRRGEAAAEKKHGDLSRDRSGEVDTCPMRAGAHPWFGNGARRFSGAMARFCGSSGFSHTGKGAFEAEPGIAPPTNRPRVGLTRGVSRRSGAGRRPTRGVSRRSGAGRRRTRGVSRRNRPGIEPTRAFPRAVSEGGGARRRCHTGGAPLADDQGPGRAG